ncbi:hypothetical protein EDC04DRAFT_2746763, partial [Pisolithus marmoratus]
MLHTLTPWTWLGYALCWESSSCGNTRKAAISLQHRSTTSVVDIFSFSSTSIPRILSPVGLPDSTSPFSNMSLCAVTYPGHTMCSQYSGGSR